MSAKERACLEDDYHAALLEQMDERTAATRRAAAAEAERDHLRAELDTAAQVMKEACATTDHLRAELEQAQRAVEYHSNARLLEREAKDYSQDRVRKLERRLALIHEWTLQYGASLVPHGVWTDSFGDGMRAAKQQVSALVSKLIVGLEPSEAGESPLCYHGDCAKMTGRARPCPIHDAPAPQPAPCDELADPEPCSCEESEALRARIDQALAHLGHREAPLNNVHLRKAVEVLRG